MTMSTRETIARVIFRFHFWFLTKHTRHMHMRHGSRSRHALSPPCLPEDSLSCLQPGTSHSSVFSFASRNYKTIAVCR